MKILPMKNKNGINKLSRQPAIAHTSSLPVIPWLQIHTPTVPRKHLQVSHNKVNGITDHINLINLQLNQSNLPRYVLIVYGRNGM